MKRKLAAGNEASRRSSRFLRCPKNRNTRDSLGGRGPRVRQSQLRGLIYSLRLSRGRLGISRRYQEFSISVAFSTTTRLMETNTTIVDDRFHRVATINVNVYAEHYRIALRMQVRVERDYSPNASDRITLNLRRTQLHYERIGSYYGRKFT